MLTPAITTVIMLMLCALLLIVIPILGAVPRLKEAISYRWCVTAIFIILACGCVLDFSHLENDTREVVIVGSIVTSGLFILVRSIEKLTRKGEVSAEVKYKDASARVKVKEENNGKTEDVT